MAICSPFSTALALSFLSLCLWAASVHPCGCVHACTHMHMHAFPTVLFVYSLSKIRVDVGMNFSQTLPRVPAAGARAPEMRWKIALGVGSSLLLMTRWLCSLRRVPGIAVSCPGNCLSWLSSPLHNDVPASTPGGTKQHQEPWGWRRHRQAHMVCSGPAHTNALC
jgi:hypothetical protein